MLTAARQFCRHEVDAGWAWVVCVVSFFMQFVVFGTIQSFGTLFISLLQDFNAGEAETAWVGSLGYGFLFVMGPLSTVLCEHFGCRAMACVGSVLTAISLILTSFATSIFSMYFTFGVVWGIGSSFLFFSGLLVLRFYFSRNISLANGITMTGAGFGTLILNVMLQEIDSKYGWRVGMRVLSVFTALTFIGGCLYLPPPTEQYTAAGEWSQFERARLWYKLKRLIDPRPWRDRAFIMWMLSLAFILFAYFFPYTYLVRMAVSLDVPVSKGSLLIGYLSIAAIFGKLLSGRLADLPRVRRLYIFVTSALFLSVSSMCVTAAKSYDGLFAYALIAGFFDGCFVVTVPLITQDIVGREQLAKAIGSLYGVLAFPLTLGPPVLGELYKSTGSFTAAFFFASGIILLGVSLTYIVQKFRPELTTRQEWPGPNNREVYTSNLIPDPSVQSMSVDALSGMCVTETGPTLPHLTHIEGNAYQRFDDFPQTDSNPTRIHSEQDQTNEPVTETECKPNAEIGAERLNRSEAIAIPEIIVAPSSHSGSFLGSSVSSTEPARNVESRSVAEVFVDVSKEAAPTTAAATASTTTLVEVNVPQTRQEPKISDSEILTSNGSYSNTHQEESQFITIQSQTPNLETLALFHHIKENHGTETIQEGSQQAVIPLIKLSVSSENKTYTIDPTTHKQRDTDEEPPVNDFTKEPNMISSTMHQTLVTATPVTVDELIKQPVPLTEVPESPIADKIFLVENKESIVQDQVSNYHNHDIMAEIELVRIPPPPASLQRAKSDGSESISSTHSKMLADGKDIQIKNGEIYAEKASGSAAEELMFRDTSNTLEVPEMATLNRSLENLSEEEGLQPEESPDTPEMLEIIRIPPPPGIPRTGKLVQLDSDSPDTTAEAEEDPSSTACIFPQSGASLNSCAKAGNNASDTNSTLNVLNREQILKPTPSESEVISHSGLVPLAAAPRQRERLHFAIIDQLNVLSERLEAVAARQIQEEKEPGNGESTEQLAEFSLTNQALTLTPLHSTNHSLPLTPVRGRSGVGSTTAPTPLHTPSSDLHTTGPTPTYTPLGDRRTPMMFTPAQSVSGFFDTGADLHVSNTSCTTPSRCNVFDNAQTGIQDLSGWEDSSAMASDSGSASKDAITRRQSRSSSLSEDPQEFVLNDWSHLELRDGHGLTEGFSSKASSRSNISTSSSVKSTSEVTSLTQPIDIVGSTSSATFGVHGTSSERFNSFRQLEQSGQVEHYLQQGLHTLLLQQQHIQLDKPDAAIEIIGPKSNLEPNTAESVDEPVPNAFQNSSTRDPQGLLKHNPFQREELHSSRMEVILDPYQNAFQISDELDSQAIQEIPPYQDKVSDSLKKQDTVSTQNGQLILETLTHCKHYDSEDLGDALAVDQRNPSTYENLNAIPKDSEKDGMAIQPPNDGNEKQPATHARDAVHHPWTTFLPREENLIFEIENDNETSEYQFRHSQDVSNGGNLGNVYPLPLSGNKNANTENMTHFVDENSLFSPLQFFSDVDYIPQSEVAVKIPPPPRLSQRKRTQQSVFVGTGHSRLQQETAFRHIDVESTYSTEHSKHFDAKNVPGPIEENETTQRSTKVLMQNREVTGTPLVSSDENVLPSSKEVVDSHAYFAGTTELSDIRHSSIVPQGFKSESNKGEITDDLDDIDNDSNLLKSHSESLIQEDIAPLLVRNNEGMQYLNLKDLPNDSQVLRKCLSNTSSTDDDSSASTDSSMSENEMPYSKLQEDDKTSEQG